MSEETNLGPLGIDSRILGVEPALEEQAKCTLCAKIESPGFYTGCMCKDLGPQNGWDCDGDGHLTRKTVIAASKDTQ